MSPPFANLQTCQSEVTQFSEVNDPSQTKLIKVVKTPVDDEQLRKFGDGFSGVVNHEFFEEDTLTGRVLEFEESFGEDLKRRYYEKVYDVAYDVNQTLARSIDETGVGTVDSPKAYLATTTLDLKAENEAIRRELIEQGFRVVPDKPLPLVDTDLEAAVAAYLDDCQLYVQLVGGSYGVVPENAQHSMLELQSRQSEVWCVDNDVPRLIWDSGNRDSTDQRQHAFLEHLHTQDVAAENTELIEGSIGLFKEVLGQHLNRSATPPPTIDASSSASDVYQAYLVCESEDEGATEPLEDFLFQQGFEVCMPNFECPSEQVSEMHRENLVHSDVVVIFYGSAPKS